MKKEIKDIRDYSYTTEERIEKGIEALKYLIDLERKTRDVIEALAYEMYHLKYPTKQITKGYKRIIREEFHLVY